MKIFIFIFIFSLNSTLKLIGQIPKLIVPIGHSNIIKSMNLSYDGKKVITASFDNTAKIWDIQNEKLLLTLIGHTSGLRYAEFSHDNERVVTASDDNSAKVWSVSNGKLLLSLEGHKNYITIAKFCPKDKTIVTVGGGYGTSKDFNIRIWNASSGKLLHSLFCHIESINSIEFSPNGDKFVTSSNDNTAKLWDVESGKLVHSLEDHLDRINSAKFSPDGKKLITASSDNTAKIWDTENGKLIITLIGHTDEINSAEFSYDSKKIITASKDHTSKIWDVENGKQINNFFGHINSINSAQFSKDEKKVLTSSDDKSVKLWDAEKALLLESYDFKNKFDINSYGIISKFDVTNKKLISAYGRDLYVCNYESKEKNKLFINSGFKYICAKIDPSEKKLVFGSITHNVKIWDIENGKIISVLKGHKDDLTSCDFSKDGARLVTASTDHSAKIWDISSGKILTDLERISGDAVSVEFTNNPTKLLTYDFTNNMIWDINSGEFITGSQLTVLSPDGKLAIVGKDTIFFVIEMEKFKIKGKYIENDLIISAKFSPNSKKIISVSDSTAKVWEATGGKLVSNLKHNSRLTMALFSPDSKKILTTNYNNNTVNIWDSESGEFLFSLNGHKNYINTIDFSLSGNRIITSSEDSTSKIWNLYTGELILSLDGHLDKVTTAKFCNNDKIIITCSKDDKIKLWNENNGKLITSLDGEIMDESNKFLVVSNNAELKIFDLDSLRQLYSIYQFDSLNYLVIDSLSHFDGTKDAMRTLYFVCDEEIIELDQLKDLLWEPGLVSKIMGVNPEPIGAKTLSEVEKKSGGICGALPIIEEKGIKENKYYFEIKERKGGIGNITLYVDNIPKGRNYSKKDLQRKSENLYELIIPMDSIRQFFANGVNNEVSIKAWTANNEIISRGTSISNVEINKKYENGVIQPHLYAVNVGINQYKGPDLKLNYAAKDAQSFGKVVQKAAQNLLNTGDKNRIHTYELIAQTGSTHWPTKDNIIKVFQEISTKATPEDIILFFFSGHGTVTEESKKFYFLTSEATSSGIGGVENLVAISSEELTEWLRKIKARKQILVMDACNTGQGAKEVSYAMAGKTMPGDQKKALDRLNNRSGLYILAGSSADQQSYESNLFDHGILTYSLLESIKNGKAMRDGKYLDVSTWFNAAADRAKELAENVGKRQAPEVFAQASFPIGLVDEEVMKVIDLGKEKKVFGRSSFLNEALRMRDDLNLSKSVDDFLKLGLMKKEVANVLFLESDNGQPYNINGIYKVNGDKIDVEVFVYKGVDTTIVFESQFTGSKEKLEDLVEKIVANVVNNIAKY